MPNRQRTMCSFFTADGAQPPSAPVPLPAPAAVSEAAAPDQSIADGSKQTGAEVLTQQAGASAASRSAATATPARDRRHNIGEVPMPWGAKPKQDALRGAITSFDLDGRCSYAALHKCHSAAWHWSRCIVIDHPDVTVQWEGTVRVPLVDLVRCERCAVGIHPPPRVRHRLLGVVRWT